MTDASANGMPLISVSTELCNPRDPPGGLPEAMLSAALCGPMKGHLACVRTPGHRRYQRAEPSPPLPPRDSDALGARDGFRTLADGAKVE
jgi:hypothetical protein